VSFVNTYIKLHIYCYFRAAAIRSISGATRVWRQRSWLSWRLLIGWTSGRGRSLLNSRSTTPTLTCTARSSCWSSFSQQVRQSSGLLKCINQSGNYLRITWDANRWATQPGVLVNRVRGWLAKALVYYVDGERRSDPVSCISKVVCSTMWSSGWPRLRFTM